MYTVLATKGLGAIYSVGGGVGVKEQDDHPESAPEVIVQWQNVILVWNPVFLV